MYIFKRFQKCRNGFVARFRVGESEKTFGKVRLQKLHDNLKRNLPTKGFSTDTEQTKFALDHWPPKDVRKQNKKNRQ